jgi:Trp operon repressor
MLTLFKTKEAVMAGKDIVMLSAEERKRLHLIHKILEGDLRQVDASKLLGLSYRQINRITNQVKAKGDKEVAHKLRGKVSNRKIAVEKQEVIMNLYREKYQGFGPLLASEKLLEENNIKISDETLRKWLLTSGDWEKKCKRKKHRNWRERKAHCGEMAQMDGSHHDWFEGRGEKSVLMGYIDDATNIVYARFTLYEGTIPAMESFKGYIKQNGLPLNVYADRHSTYKSNGKASIEQELSGNCPLSEFGRALKELGVNLIHANSAPAKGRIERLFKTFQDRVVKEMRLKGISSIEQGNQFLDTYLSIFNKRFAVEAKEDKDLHRELPKDTDLETIFCIKTERALRNDFTVAHDKKLYQVKETVTTKRVIVEERLDGSLAITYKGRGLTYQEIEQQNKKREPQVIKTGKKYIPAKNHPWNRFPIANSKKGYGQNEKVS